MLTPEARAKVKIVNPVENGSQFTSRKRALQYVRTGRASFVGRDQIRFLETDQRNKAAATRAAIGYVLSKRMLTKRELQGIPFVHASKAYR